MKRFLAFALALILILSLAACAGNNNNVPDPTDRPVDTDTSKVTPEPSDPTETPSDPTEAPIDDIDDPVFPTDDPNEALPVVISGNGTCFISYPDGTLYGWGHNEYGQVGNHSAENVALPVHIADGLVPVIVGETVFALSDKGTLWGWGRNDSGQLGLGDTENRNSPEEIMYLVKRVYKGGTDHYFALTEGGQVYRWGGGETNPTLYCENVREFDYWRILTNDGKLMIQHSDTWDVVAENVVAFWGDFFEDAEGRLYRLWSRDPLLVAESFKEIFVTNGAGIFVLGENGELYMYNHESQRIELVMEGVREFFVETFSNAGWEYDVKFALKENGELWSWGWTSNAALGKDARTDGSTPELVADHIRKFVTNGAMTYAITFAGEVLATGMNAGADFIHGSLGDGGSETRFGFVRIEGLKDIRAIYCDLVEETVYHGDGTTSAAVYTRTFAVDANGNIFAWGYNGDGLLGVNSGEETVLAPMRVNVTKD